MTEQQPLTSQEQLAQDIANALLEKKLITASKHKKLPQQIAMGILDTDDWALLVDIATEQSANSIEGDND